MIRGSVVLGLARAEARLMRRLVRYWVFVVLATLFTLLQFANFFIVHWVFSWGSASAAMTNPRYWLGNVGGLFVLAFMLGITFMAFDLRARDQRERIIEVLDAKPYSNVELVIGRFIGIFIATWIPTVIVTLLLMAGSAAFGAPLEPWSAVGFLLFMAPPAYICWIGLIFLLTTLLPNRLLVAVVGVLLLVALFAASFFIPLYASPLTDIGGGIALPFPPSDIAPALIDATGVAQRSGWALLGVGMLMLAAGWHQRRDDGRRAMRAVGGTITAVAGVAILAALTLGNRATVERKADWRAALQAHADEPAPDVAEVAGQVRIDPGRRLTMDLRIGFRAPVGAALDEALFTLNPGLRVDEVEVGGAAAMFSHEDGLLTIRLDPPVPSGEQREIGLHVEGLPDRNFSYLDAAIEPMDLVPAEAQLIVLGYEASMFDGSFVALLPGVAWLPQSGVPVAPEGRRPRTDFFTVDLDVDVPEGWLVAGPGRRDASSTAAEAGRARFHFGTEAPLPEVALVAARYESVSTEIDGVTMELLVDPAHAETMDWFADADDEIRDWLKQRLDEADELGLTYPYDALTLAEVPGRLRGYAGGWRMDTTLAQPSMILIREAGFPTARFDSRFAQRRVDQLKDEEGGVPRAKRRILEAFFQNDVNGGNPFLAAARSFFGFQTVGSGQAGVPLDFVLEQMTSRLLTDNGGYFSVHFFDRNFGQEFQRAGMAMGSPDRVSSNYSEVLTHMLTSTTKVWETVDSTSLDHLDPWSDPERAINVLSLKGTAMARSMLDRFGQEKTGRFLAALRERTRGGSYDRDDLLAAGEAIGEDLGPWLDLWLEETQLPGFVVDEARAFRVRDPADDAPKQQVLVTIRNDEPVAGLLRLEYRTENRGFTDNRSDPVLIPGQSAREIGLVSSEPITAVRVMPYLSRNREPFNVSLPVLDEETIVDAEPFVGAREVAWTAADSDAIVVDDLDAGFSIDDASGSGMLRVAGQGKEDEVLDDGLPVAESRRPNRWSRRVRAQAWGKYRHTMAVVRPGEGKRAAVFSTEVPRAGQWELEYHVPGMGAGTELGTLNLEIVDDSGSRDATLDAKASVEGWNSVGIYEVADGEVRVRVDDRSDGAVVFADAIRWTPVGGGATREVARR